MTKLLIIGKFWKDSNGCASFSLPHEDSKLIDYKKKYLIEIHFDEVLDTKAVKRRGDDTNKIIIRTK